MGVFDRLFKDDINKAIKRFRKMDGAVLVDVRKPEEYAAGHIPGSINIPETEIEKIDSLVLRKNTPIFVYCLSGAKSWNATNSLQTMGYTNVKNIGGINKYTGEKEVSN